MLSEKPWKLERLVHLILGILFCVSAVILLEAGVEHFLGKEQFNEGSLLYLVFGSLALHGSILLGTGIFLALHRLSWNETFGFNVPPVGRAMMLGAAAALVFLPVGIFLQNLSLFILEKLHVPTTTEQAVAEFDKAVSWPSRAYLVFFAVILAPVAEEIFFRGILYPAIKQRGFPRTALWGTSVVFAAIHHTAAIFVPLLLLSFIMVWLYEKTDNLLAPITAHAMFNGINVVLLLFSDYLTDSFQRLFHHLR